MREKSVIIVFALIILIVTGIFSYSAGYANGSKDAIKFVVKVGKNFVNISIDEEMFANGIFNYQNNINACFEKPEIK